ncbi:lipase family protein [Cohnella thailandensis]|uniref:Lipase family protein n=1 Tax=Cohnella thailandensis TaxID=557557 RepID=A0A841SYE5_9BACL|nr:lipase family protein [Cohnella thailandensis]MBB6633781.1 lipase family protein [Cohnella thailandensis]MBP1976572.1 triacylglycerol lipase [Cohnella thailandensis]
MGTNGFDVRRAILLAGMCGQTYKQYDHPDGSFIVPAPYAAVAAFDAQSLNRNRELFGFILESEEEVVIAFRGTSSTSDWLSDAIAYQMKYPYCRHAGQTHRGFTQIYKSARAGIMSALARLSKEKRLVVTGHSLGGALATLCALDVATNVSFRSCAVYTFGSPRAGDPSFVRAFMDAVPNSHRVSNLFDAVPYLPPIVFRLPRSSKVYEYRHVRTVHTMEFRKRTMSGNHVIGSYFWELAKKDPAYTSALCAANPGFCPTRPQ